MLLNPVFPSLSNTFLYICSILRLCLAHFLLGSKSAEKSVCPSPKVPAEPQLCLIGLYWVTCPSLDSSLWSGKYLIGQPQGTCPPQSQSRRFKSTYGTRTESEGGFGPSETSQKRTKACQQQKVVWKRTLGSGGTCWLECQNSQISRGLVQVGSSTENQGGDAEGTWEQSKHRGGLWTRSWSGRPELFQAKYILVLKNKFQTPAADGYQLTVL